MQTISTVYGQAYEPLDLAKKIFSKDSLLPIGNFITGEYKGYPNGQDLQKGATTKFIVLEQTQKTAVVAMTSVLLVFQMGQPRIWMAMSRDGLMPKKFAEIHPKHKTPSFATIITGLVVGIPIFFTDENFVLDFTSIGTLFAFVLVCGGVLLLSPQSETEIAERENKGKFKIPYVNSKFIFPSIVILGAFLVFKYIPTFFTDVLNFSEEKLATNIPMLVFLLVCSVMSVLSFLKNLSLIPLLGLVSCCYLLTGMAVSNWMWFGTWLVIGLIFYFLYGYKKSKLNAIAKK